VRVDTIRIPHYVQVQVVVDYGAIGKYIVALAVQVTLSFGMWIGVDWILLQLGYFNTKLAFLRHNSRFWIKFVMVYLLNLQVVKFNPLATISERTVDKSPGRKRPSWTPPGWVFAIMWPFFVFGTRAYTMVVIADAHVGKFANPVTFSMMVHFGFGGLWSNINRVEEQLGLSMIMLYGLFLSKAYTAYLAYRIVPGAGIALACPLSWLAAAAALGTDTWRLNPDSHTGKLQPLLPTKTITKTKQL